MVVAMMWTHVVVVLTLTTAVDSLDHPLTLGLFSFVKKVKADIARHGNPISELRDVTCRMGSHSVTCHPTSERAPPRVVLFTSSDLIGP